MIRASRRKSSTTPSLFPLLLHLSEPSAATGRLHHPSPPAYASVCRRENLRRIPHPPSSSPMTLVRSPLLSSTFRKASPLLTNAVSRRDDSPTRLLSTAQPDPGRPSTSRTPKNEANDEEENQLDHQTHVSHETRASKTRTGGRRGRKERKKRWNRPAAQE